jgi:hypothetical protein
VLLLFAAARCFMTQPLSIHLLGTNAVVVSAPSAFEVFNQQIVHLLR